MRLSHLLVCCLSLCAAHSAQAGPTIVIVRGEPFVEDRSQHLVCSKPMDNERIAGSPKDVTLTFRQPVRADKSFIRITNMYGAQVNSGAVKVSADGLHMTATPPQSLPPGRYSVKWRARCNCRDDTDIDGYYRFYVK